MLTVKDFLYEIKLDKKAKQDEIILYEPNIDSIKTCNIADLTEKDLWKFVITFNKTKDKIYKLTVV